MSESGVASSLKSTRPVRKSLRTMSGTLPTFGGRVLARLQAMWPQKTDMQLAARINLSDRACRDILAKRARLSVEALGALLITEDGLAVLEGLMGDASPRWWKGVKRQAQLADLRRRLEALEREEI